MTTSRTRLVGVIGNPVGHSLSPVMHTAAFEELGLDYVHVAFTVDDVACAVAGVRALGIRGVNVTIPHKAEVMKHLDKVDELAGKIGAVNAVVNEGGVLTGYNTDCSGAVSALLSVTGLSGKTVMVLGAGGAARAVAFGVAREGAKVVVVNRTAKKARELANDVCRHFRGSARVGSIDDMPGCDVVVNTTPVGMYPDTGKTPVDGKHLSKGLVVMDAVYNPLKTRLLADAEDAGCVTVSGLEMFVAQGAKSFELFTGKEAPVGVMRDAVLSVINK